MDSDKSIYVYKSAGKGEYIVVLTINLSDTNTKTNLKRSGVVNPDYAAFRCNKALVVKIYNKTTKEEIKCITSNFDNIFKYKKGEEVIEPNYDENINHICSTGIHFFLTEEAANNYNYNYIYNDDKDGEYKIWDSNGNLLLKYNVVNGKKDVYECYYENGQIHKKCKYYNDYLDGPFEEYYVNGKLKQRCTFLKGSNIITGMNDEFYDNGQQKSKTIYINGYKNGLHEKRNENGILTQRCDYIDGRINGQYEEFYDNGQLKLIRNYTNDSTNGLCKKFYDNGKQNSQPILLMVLNMDHMKNSIIMVN